MEENTLWSEIEDSAEEIFDLNIPEYDDRDFDFNSYLNAEYDY
tara:strand:+ start:3574 stop:3702 length:129 start_codon:yes stop_codon:yes gene_type:complete